MAVRLTHHIAHNRQLLKDDDVIFAAYKIPHPLEYKLHLKIQTRKDTTPENVLLKAMTEVTRKLEVIENSFSVCVVVLLVIRRSSCSTDRQQCCNVIMMSCVY